MKVSQSILVDTVIIGGGAAGIGAAFNLNFKAKNSSWRLLEARDGFGGRIQKIRIDGKDIDTGAYEMASFECHGSNELLDLVNSGFCRLNLREKTNRVVYFDEQMGQFSEHQIKKIDEILEIFQKFVVSLCNPSHSPLSLQQCVSKFKKTEEEFLKLPNKLKNLFDLKINMIEQEEASDMEEMPALETIAYIEGMEVDEIDQQPIPEGTYYGLLTKIIQKMPPQNIQCGVAVTAVRKLANGLTQVSAKSIRKEGVEEITYLCQKVICAVPLAILKENAISFSPPLPQKFRDSLDKLGVGVMEKIILAFQKPFWPEDMQRIKIAGKQYGRFAHFINLSGPKDTDPSQTANILVGFMTSAPAKKMWSSLTKQQIVNECLAYFKSLFPSNQILLRESFVTDWAGTQFIKQSFSNFRMGATVQMTQEMRKPIDNRIWFAGEYLFGENMGCAHGAFNLGFRAGQEVGEQIFCPKL